MSRPMLVFWGSALLVSLLVTAGTALFLPYEALGLTAPGDRERAWHLCLWTGGVMSILFGTSGLLGLVTPLGFRDVHEAGSVDEAIASRRKARKLEGGYDRNFAWWLVAVGTMLIMAYFAAWASGPAINP